MSKIIVILGAPCSGKGTQSVLLKKFHHLSAGEILRKKYPKGTETRTLLDAGNLIRVDLMNNIMAEEIQNNKTRDIIIDGYPRTVPQANFLKNFNISNVIFLNISKNVAFDRMINREICEKCEKTYSKKTNCCMPTNRRIDDNSISFEKRFLTFQKDLTDILTILSVPVFFVNAENSINSIAEEIQKFI